MNRETRTFVDPCCSRTRAAIEAFGDRLPGRVCRAVEKVARRETLGTPWRLISVGLRLRNLSETHVEFLATCLFDGPTGRGKLLMRVRRDRSQFAATGIRILSRSPRSRPARFTPVVLALGGSAGSSASASECAAARRPRDVYASIA